MERSHPYQGCSDGELIEFIQSDDPAAFVEIYKRYSLTLLKHAYNKLRNREDARDMVQEAFAGLWQKRKTLRSDNNLAGYLYITVRNLALNHFARSDVKEKYHASMQEFAKIESLHFSADQHIREKQLTEIIKAEIEALPSKMRLVFKLSREEHLNHKEIASKLKISERTVSSHITHALRILRAKLEFLLLLSFLGF